MDEIGARLREARMHLKIDINDVESRTKIRAKYLRAMENEEWDLLPGEVYIRSFLRTYADFLGLDSRELLDEFRRRYESPSDHEPPPIAPPSRGARDRERSRGPRRRIPAWVIVVLVLVVVVGVLYLVGTGNKTSQDNAVAPHTTATHAAHTPVHHHAKAPARKVIARPKSVSVTLVPTGPNPVYVCMVNGLGKVLIAGKIYDAGETIPTEKAGRLRLTLGNASVTVTANGKPVAVTASSGAIGLQFTPAGHTTLTGSALPTCAS
jgi:cytoskeleton protein RodZ